jgi:hypothetical protein
MKRGGRRAGVPARSDGRCGQNSSTATIRGCERPVAGAIVEDRQTLMGRSAPSAPSCAPPNGAGFQKTGRRVTARRLRPLGPAINSIPIRAQPSARLASTAAENWPGDYRGLVNGIVCVKKDAHLCSRRDDRSSSPGVRRNNPWRRHNRIGDYPAHASCLEWKSREALPLVGALGSTVPRQSLTSLPSRPDRCRATP